MPSREVSKAQKREIKRLCGLSHSRELTGATSLLEQDFARWRSGEIDVFELSDFTTDPKWSFTRYTSWETRSGV